MFPVEIIEFMKHNKLMIKNTVDFYSECCKDRCNVLHYPEIKKQHLSREIKSNKIRIYEWNNSEL